LKHESRAGRVLGAWRRVEARAEHSEADLVVPPHFVDHFSSHKTNSRTIMIARNYFFDNNKAFDIKATMHRVNTMIEDSLFNYFGEDNAEFHVEVHKEKEVFTMKMWDFIYQPEFSNWDLMWCPINKQYVHIAWFFHEFGVVVVPTDLTMEEESFIHSDDSSIGTIGVDDLPDLSLEPLITDQEEILFTLQASQIADFDSMDLLNDLEPINYE
jgi:hypothetical protein